MPVTNNEVSNEEKPRRSREKPSNRAERMRRQASETEHDESAVELEQIFNTKLEVIQTYEKKLSTISDPNVRKTLQTMIRRERKDLMNLAELMELVENGADMNTLSRIRRQINYQAKMHTGQSINFWLGAAAVGAILIPGVREQFRPLAVKVTEGVLGLSEQAQSIFSGIKEDLEDLVSEAQFERFKSSIDAGIEQIEPGEEKLQ